MMTEETLEARAKLVERETPSSDDSDSSGTVLNEQSSNSLLDREERAVAALLTRFKNLITLATMPASELATKEAAAAQAFQMEVESNALVSSARARRGLRDKTDGY
jgi:hypothetical protein